MFILEMRLSVSSFSFSRADEKCEANSLTVLKARLRGFIRLLLQLFNCLFKVRIGQIDGFQSSITRCLYLFKVCRQETG